MFRFILVSTGLLSNYQKFVPEIGQIKEKKKNNYNKNPKSPTENIKDNFYPLNTLS